MPGMEKNNVLKPEQARFRKCSNIPELDRVGLRSTFKDTKILSGYNSEPPLVRDGQGNPCISKPSPSPHSQESFKRKGGDSEGLSYIPERMLEGLDEEGRAAFKQERNRRIEELMKMIRARKLCLVLDLDHTLLNSVKYSDVDPKHDEVLKKVEMKDRCKSRRHLFQLSHIATWTKLRPGIWSFLDRASELYELHLYTMGSNAYAKEMAKVLDPTGTLFSGRISSRGDAEDHNADGFYVPCKTNKDLEGVMWMESAIVIIDDTEKIWPHHKENLIVVERYTYFPNSRQQFGLSGPSLLEIGHDERPEDGMLASALKVIEQIHDDFFSKKLSFQLDVRDLLSNVQRSVLMGCRILFSRVFPSNEAHPYLNPVWQLAEKFGAVCTTHLDNQVTHIVAATVGAEKMGSCYWSSCCLFCMD